jgi:hypothetical protein
MQTKTWSVLLPLILVWVVSVLAGISFLHQALTDKSRPASRGWRKFLRAARVRLTFAAGIGLILWVISGVIWVLAN